MSSRHSKSLNATACTRVSTCLRPIVCLCVHIVCVCVSATSSHAQPLCACVFSARQEHPCWDYASPEKMRGCNKPLTTSEEKVLESAGYLWTNESTARAKKKLLWPLGRVCFPNMSAWTDESRILNELELLPEWENTRKNPSLSSCPKTIFPIWQLSKAPSSKANLPAVFLYLEQSSFPARLALKYICILVSQHFLLWWKRDLHSFTLRSAHSVIIIITTELLWRPTVSLFCFLLTYYGWNYKFSRKATILPPPLSC